MQCNLKRTITYGLQMKMPQGGKQCTESLTRNHPAALSVISKSPCFKMKLFYLKVEFPNISASTEHINMDLPKK